MFSACFTGFLRVRTARKILGIFEVFLGVFEKTKEKKGRLKGSLGKAVFIRDRKTGLLEVGSFPEMSIF